MRILLCNDDGISSPGIVEMARQLSEIGKVWVVAPDQERSAASNSLTLSHPLRVKQFPFPVNVEAALAVSGTPADCAKFALANVFKDKPDMVVSGINRGPNMGVDVFYSGTVAAAFEGAFKGISSFAVSLDSFSATADFSIAAKWAANLIKQIATTQGAAARVYNINVPAIEDSLIKGVCVTRTGKIDYAESYHEREDPNGKPYYWVCGNPRILDSALEFDVGAVKSGFVSVTPLGIDLTDREFLPALQNLFVRE